MIAFFFSVPCYHFRVYWAFWFPQVMIWNSKLQILFEEKHMREKCPNTGFFLVRIFPRSDWIRRDAKKLRIWHFPRTESLSVKHGAFGTKYSRMDQVKFFKGCLSQVSLSPFLNTLPHLLCKMISGVVVKNNP